MEELTFVDQFLICQLSDLHFSVVTDLAREFDYINKVLNSYATINNLTNIRKPDMLVLNGDSFMNANKSIVERTIHFFDDLKIPYAFNFGNHDQQGSYTSNFIRSLLEESPTSLFKDQLHDDVYGNSNYVINLTNAGDLKYQIYMFDSNSYVLGDYDIIHDDQVEWYERCLLAANGYESKPEVISENTFKPSLAFAHIPPKEFQRAIDDFQTIYGKPCVSYQDNFVNINHKVSSSSMEDNLIEKMQELKSTVALCCAHDHTNSMDLFYKGHSDWPMRFIYGNKTGDNAGFKKDMIGATFYTLNEIPKVSKYGNKMYFDILKVNVEYGDEGAVNVEWMN